MRCFGARAEWARARWSRRSTPASIERQARLVLIEIHREDIESLPRLLHLLADSGRQCLLFCDDLSFDAGETSYKSLKAVLEGGIEGRPANVLLLRHLQPPAPDAATDDRQ